MARNLVHGTSETAGRRHYRTPARVRASCAGAQTPGTRHHKNNATSAWPRKPRSCTKSATFLSRRESAVPLTGKNLEDDLSQNLEGCEATHPLPPHPPYRNTALRLRTVRGAQGHHQRALTKSAPSPSEPPKTTTTSIQAARKRKPYSKAPSGHFRKRTPQSLVQE